MTCVYYSTESEPPENYIKVTSICTISENLRHDPVFICAHLQPVIQRVRELSPNLKHLHILSDGPSTQYRNKTMFHLMATYLTNEFNVDTITWHYSEKGHGKGAPDGVGGCIKRVCDASVARGNDVSSYDELMSCVKKNCHGIEVYGVDESVVPKIQNIVDESMTKPFKGTFKVHQLTWSAINPTTIHARRLSCLICAAHSYCRHFTLGEINIKFKTHNSPSTSSCSSRLETPDMQLHDLAVVDSPGNPATPDASTVPKTPSPCKTSDVLTEYNSQNRRPFKRRRIYFYDSDSSVDLSENIKRRILDSDDENMF